MNLRFVEAFVVTARFKSFKAASEQMHATQPAISSRIAALEEELGVRLFERSSRNVTLTPTGSALLPLAEDMLALRGRMLAAAGVPRSLSGTLRIGVMETVTHTWLPALLSRYSALHPRVSIELTSDITPTLRDELLKGRLDCAFLSEEITEGFIENRKLMTLRVGWAVSPRFAMAAEPRAFEDIVDLPLISFHRESSFYRSILQAAGRRAIPRISFFSSLAAMIELAKTGFGVAPLPLAVIEPELARGELRVLDVSPAPLALPIVGSLRADAPSPAAEAMVSLAAAVCDEYVAERRDAGPARARLLDEA